MIRYAGMISALVILALAAPGKPVAPSGSWKVDSRTSDVQLSTDGTTDFGKKNTTFTLGFARVGGTVKLDGADSTKSSFHVDFYPSNSTAPTIDHDGKVSSEWFSNRANNMMICFHSQSVEQTSNGRLKASGTLGLIRVDRNVQLTPSEAYSGPEYGAPIFNHVQSPATFEFDPPSEEANSQKAGVARMSGSTSMAREDFPSLFKAVVATQWPPLVKEKNCKTTGASEAYAGAQCTGTFLAPAFPVGPNASFGEDYPGPQNFNTIAGQHFTIAIHLRLTPEGSRAKASAGN
jgi:polyisoprenoid-binding protein YceI